MSFDKVHVPPCNYRHDEEVGHVRHPKHQGIFELGETSKTTLVQGPFSLEQEAETQSRTMICSSSNSQFVDFLFMTSLTSPSLFSRAFFLSPPSGKTYPQPTPPCF